MTFFRLLICLLLLVFSGLAYSHPMLDESMITDMLVRLYLIGLFGLVVITIIMYTHFYMARHPAPNFTDAYIFIGSCFVFLQIPLLLFSWIILSILFQQNPWQTDPNFVYNINIEYLIPIPISLYAIIFFYWLALRFSKLTTD